jgi:hypothetical protein
VARDRQKGNAIFFRLDDEDYALVKARAGKVSPSGWAEEVVRREARRLPDAVSLNWVIGALQGAGLSQEVLTRVLEALRAPPPPPTE